MYILLIQHIRDGRVESTAVLEFDKARQLETHHAAILSATMPKARQPNMKYYVRLRKLMDYVPGRTRRTPAQARALFLKLQRQAKAGKAIAWVCEQNGVSETWYYTLARTVQAAPDNPNKQF
jgi:hypothetical protein